MRARLGLTTGRPAAPARALSRKFGIFPSKIDYQPLQPSTTTSMYVEVNEARGDAVLGTLDNDIDIDNRAVLTGGVPCGEYDIAL